MRKIFFTILCWIKKIELWIHCKSCNVPCNKTYVSCELVNLREALHLLSMGFEPVQVDYNGDGAHDTFYFRRKPALLMALTDYRRAIRKTVNAVDYDSLTAVCTIPVVGMVMWSATLEDNTCDICAGYDGQYFALDNHPALPAHPGCRCAIVPVVQGWQPSQRLDNTKPAATENNPNPQKEIVDYTTVNAWRESRGLK